MVKLLKCHLKGETCRKLANGRILIILRKKWPRASSAHILGLFSIIFKRVYIQQIRGERLQDHWSSGLEFIWSEHQENMSVQ